MCQIGQRFSGEKIDARFVASLDKFRPISLSIVAHRAQPSSTTYME